MPGTKPPPPIEDKSATFFYTFEKERQRYDECRHTSNSHTLPRVILGSSIGRARQQSRGQHSGTWKQLHLNRDGIRLSMLEQKRKVAFETLGRRKEEAQEDLSSYIYEHFVSFRRKGECNHVPGSSDIRDRLKNPREYQTKQHALEVPLDQQTASKRCTSRLTRRSGHVHSVTIRRTRSGSVRIGVEEHIIIAWCWGSGCFYCGWTRIRGRPVTIGRGWRPRPWIEVAEGRGQEYA